MLELAIVDAEALRETALMNAEAALVEKYQDKKPTLWVLKNK